MLLRPHHWIKNLFIFLPLFFGKQMTNGELLLLTTGAFVAFSFVSSAVYIFNDILDLETDRLHPKKIKGPLAAGKITPQRASLIMALLLILGLVGGGFLSQTVFFLSLLYLGLNILYTLLLKHIAILDITMIAIGFVIRIFIGSAVTAIPLSIWIILMTFLLALFLALAKRRDDVLIFQHYGHKTRASIDGYNLEFLNASLVIMGAVVIVAYIMYTVSPEVIARMGTDQLYLTTIFVILGILRYLQITFVENNSGSPTEVFLSDRLLAILLLGWIASFSILIYV